MANSIQRNSDTYAPRSPDLSALYSSDRANRVPDSAASTTTSTCNTPSTTALDASHRPPHHHPLAFSPQQQHHFSAAGASSQDEHAHSPTTLQQYKFETNFANFVSSSHSAQLPFSGLSEPRQSAGSIGSPFSRPPPGPPLSAAAGRPHRARESKRPVSPTRVEPLVTTSLAMPPLIGAHQQAYRPVVEPSPVRTKFPTARIKRIMQADEEVGKVAQQTPIAVGKALELFMVSLVSRTAKLARERGHRKVSAQMLKQVIETDDQWDFLREIVSKISSEERPSKGGSSHAKGESESEEDDDQEQQRKAAAGAKGLKKKKTSG